MKLDAVLPARTLGNRCSVHFMRQGITPVWEDKAHALGGTWQLTFDLETAGNVFRNVRFKRRCTNKIVGVDDGRRSNISEHSWFDRL
jgi:hypothetical protein